MDRKWAAEQLQEFLDAIDAFAYLSNSNLLASKREEYGRKLKTNRRELADRIKSLDPVMREIMNAAKSGYGDYPEPHDASLANSRAYWLSTVKPNALRAMGIFKFGAEARERLRTDAPDLRADQLHSWVWDAAVALWEAASRQEAVHSAARSVNARLQQKLDRHDTADAALCREAFSPRPPEIGRSRLRFPGDRTSETWRSRQQGALDFGAGCFEGIRNPASHEFELELSEQIALEQLTAFSLLARWIDECDVEAADTEQ